MNQSNERTQKRRRNDITTTSLHATSSDDRVAYNPTLMIHVPTGSRTTTKILLFPPPPTKSTIIIGHGCLLIPAIFLAWWYWTKRTARRAVRGFITFTHGGESPSYMDTSTLCNGEEDDEGYEVQRNNDKNTEKVSSVSSQLPDQNSTTGARCISASPRTGSPPVASPTFTNSDFEYQYQSWTEENTLPTQTGTPSSSSTDDSTYSKFRFLQWMKRASTSNSSSRTNQHKVRATTLYHLHKVDNNIDNNNKATAKSTKVSISSQQQSKIPGCTENQCMCISESEMTQQSRKRNET